MLLYEALSLHREYQHLVQLFCEQEKPFAKDHLKSNKNWNKIRRGVPFTFPNEPSPRTLSNSKWDGVGFSLPSFVMFFISISVSCCDLMAK
jgi:hypothetical protein